VISLGPTVQERLTDHRPAGIDGSPLPGPWPVGEYAQRLQGWLRQRARLQLFGEVWNLRETRVRVYFELRDARGALPCAMWRDDLVVLGLTPGALADGAQVVVGGGLDYYPGAATSSPAFSFHVTALRIAGEGDLLAQLDRLRKRLEGEGLFAPQKTLRRPPLPRAIGVVTGEGGKARDDVLAGLARRGWAGRLVWAFAPVQDRHAAPRITRAVTDLAALDEIEVIVVARGGGSLADLFCFCDETLCRTVALLGAPLVASVGHHTDRTLLDDVAAVSCSTPTHAAEAAVPLDCTQAREQVHRDAGRLAVHGRRAVVDRARSLARLSRAPGAHLERERSRLHQSLRELRAAARRGAADKRERTARRALVLDRKVQAAGLDGRRRQRLDALAAALGAHDPQRTLERGYALIEDPAGGVVTSAATARERGALRLHFGDGAVDATVIR